jgi:acyl-CoA thioesterase
MTAGPFARATAVHGGNGAWRGEIAPTWDIAGNANGGYLLAIAARALAEESGRPDPVTVTAHYLAPGRPGPVTVAAQVLKQGRQLATGTAVLSDATRPLLAVVGSFGTPGAGGASPTMVRGTAPDMPPLEACVPVVATDTFPPPFMGHVEIRLHPDDVGFAAGRKSGVPRIRGWLRLPDGEPMDGLALLCAADALPPTIFNTDLPVAWTPTVELTVHVRARPAPGWLVSTFETRFISGGLLEEDGELWDSTGVLVAQSRQLALVPAAQG